MSDNDDIQKSLDSFQRAGLGDLLDLCELELSKCHSLEETVQKHLSSKLNGDPFDELRATDPTVLKNLSKL